MPSVTLQGTILTCEILKPKLFSDRKRVRFRLAVKNDFIHFEEENRTLLLEDMEEWIVSMRRFLAGAYATEYNLFFENVGLAVDFYPYENGRANVSREEIRNHDGVMAIRLMMRSADKRSFLGGVYTLLLHKKEIEEFSKGLQEELEREYASFLAGKGKFVFVGVSPFGFSGCSYWYLFDENSVVAEHRKKETLQKGDYVWVTMGKHNAEQIALVDAVRRFGEDDAPFDPMTVKRVLRIATEDELRGWNVRQK